MGVCARYMPAAEPSQKQEKEDERQVGKFVRLMRVRLPVLRADLSRTGKQLLCITWQAGRGEVEDNEVKKADSTDIGI